MAHYSSKEVYDFSKDWEKVCKEIKQLTTKEQREKILITSKYDKE